MKTQSIVIAAVIATAYVVRLVLHIRYTRHRAPGAARGGQASVVLLVLLFAIAAAGALRALPTARFSVITWTAVALVLLSLVIRGLALRELREFYSEAIVVRAEHRVVTGGIYRYLRHPLHLSLAVEITALAILSRLVVVAVLCSAAAIIVVVVRNRREEQVLKQSVGADYVRYAASGAWDLVDVLPRVVAR